MKPFEEKNSNKKQTTPTCTSVNYAVSLLQWKKNHLFCQLLGSCQSPNSKGTIRHSGIDLTPLSVPTHLFSPLDILFHFLFYYLPLKVWIGMLAVFVISSCKHRSVCSSLGSRGLQNRSYPSKALFCKAWRALSMFQKALWFYLTGTNAFHLGSWMRASCRSPEATSLLIRKATLLTHLKQMTTAAVAHWEFERLVYGNAFRVRGEEFDLSTVALHVAGGSMSLVSE